MAVERGTYMGPRLRRLRRDLGLTQPDMAADLGISVSYVSLLESNGRPLTAELLLRLARTYRIDVAAFAGDGGVEFTSRLQRALKDPMFADIDLPALQSADVATNFPGITEAFLRLHTAYSEAQAAIADRRARPAAEGAPDPLDEVRRFLTAHRNCLPALDDAGERIADESGIDIASRLQSRHGLKLRVVPAHVMAGQVRRYSYHHQTIYLDEMLPGASRRFQLALQLAYLELRQVIDATLADVVPSSENARRLFRRALASYAAAAIVMPYARFAASIDELAYDVEALAARFQVSFEQAAHRITTLQKPGEERVPFFLLRVDAAGNVSKRIDGAGFPFARVGGGCPLWSVHHVIRNPGQLVTQWLELPDGQRFFSVARTVLANGGGHGSPRIERAVAIGCASEHAGKLVYARDVKAAPTPIGITCSLCQRDRCPARAALPVGRHVLADDHHRGRAPFGFADD